MFVLKKGEKMKKIIFGIVGVMVTVLPASAEVDMAEIKAACEASDELLWDNSNEYCIPKNPCLDETGRYSQYCNWKTFENVYAIYYNEWKPLVKIYAKTHGLNCEPLRTENNFVWCTGKDLKVFYFSSANDNNQQYLNEKFAASQKDSLFRTGKAFKDAVCKNALGGQVVKVEEGFAYECKISASKCDIVKSILDEDSFFGDKSTVMVNPATNNCVITTSID